jgi:hypothetical protein
VTEVALDSAGAPLFLGPHLGEEPITTLGDSAGPPR